MDKAVQTARLIRAVEANNEKLDAVLIALSRIEAKIDAQRPVEAQLDVLEPAVKAPEKAKGKA